MKAKQAALLGVNKKSSRNALGDISNQGNAGTFGKAQKALKLKKQINSGKQLTSVSEVEDVEFKPASPGNRKKSKLEQSKQIPGRRLQSRYGEHNGRTIDEVDQVDLKNEKYAAQYIGDIVAHFREMELKPEYSLSPAYMSKQSDINGRMRELLVDWLNQVHLKFELCQPTFFLGSQLLDRFLSNVNVKRNKLQLVGCTALWLAAKYEEIYAPEMEDFTTISDSAFTTEDMLKTEKMILEVVQYQISCPTVYAFMRRHLKVFGADIRLQHLTAFIVELSQQKLEALKYKPSLLAAASLWLAIKVEKYNLIANKENLKVYSYDSRSNPVVKGYQEFLKTPEGEGENELLATLYWDEDTRRLSGFDESELYEPAEALREIVQSNKSSQLKAVAKKYAHQRHWEVSKLCFDVDLSSDSSEGDYSDDSDADSPAKMEADSEDEC